MNIYRKMYRHMGIHVKIYMHTYGVILRTFQYIWRTCFCMYSYVHTSEIFVSDMNVFICLYKQIWCAHVLHIFVHTCVWGTHILYEYMHTWIYTYMKIIYLYILIHAYIWYTRTHVYLYDTDISGIQMSCMFTYIRVYLYIRTYLIWTYSCIHIHVSEVHIFVCPHVYIWYTHIWCTYILYAHIHTCIFACTHVSDKNTLIHTYSRFWSTRIWMYTYIYMGWLRGVGALKS